MYIKNYYKYYKSYFFEGEFLVMYLSDLVRMGFMAATDNNTQLRMAGLEALHVSYLKLIKLIPYI